MGDAMDNAKKMTGGKKAVMIVGIAIGITFAAAVALLIALVLSLHLFTPLVFNEFFSNAQEEYLTPGIYEGLVPQGYTYDNEEQVYLQCGYMTDGKSASRIYVTKEASDGNYYNVGYVELYTADGKPYTGHTGGITSSDGFVWLANDGEGDDNRVWVLSLDEIVAKAMLEEGPIILQTSFQTESRAACCFADTEYLWVGEFHDGEKYTTKETHAFEVSGGENNALVCAYKLDPDSKYGIVSEKVGDSDVFTPELALSVTDLVQGFTAIPGGFVLSTSYAVNFSHLYFYSDPTSGEADATININGKDVPVYFLDADNLEKDVSMPPMSEEIFVRGNRIYVLFESACQKYIFGNLIRGRHTYSYGLD